MSGKKRTRQLCSHFLLLLDLPEGHELGGRGCEVEFVQDARLVRRDRRTDEGATLWGKITKLGLITLIGLYSNVLLRIQIGIR